MPKPGANEVQTQNQARLWRQPGGPRPNNAVRYSGVAEQYLALDGGSIPLGDISPIRVPDPYQARAFRNVGETREAPDFAEFTLKILERHGAIPFPLSDLTCSFNLYRLTGKCGNLSDFGGGWEGGYVEIYSYARPNGEVDLGTRTSAWDSDDAIEDSIDNKAAAIYAVGPISFGEQAGTEVDREVIDLVYCSSVACGDCGVTDNGARRLYAITQSSGGSPATFAEVLYSRDGGTTWATQNITGLGGTTNPSAIDCVGKYLLVASNTDNGYYFTTINTLTGVPGTTWTFVSSGFTASKQPNDLYAASPSEIFFVGEGGYIYKATDVAAGVTAINAGVATTADLKRVHGVDDTIVAVGESGAIVKSTNRGTTWATTTLTPTSATIRAVLVLDDYRYWIGTSGGLVYSTLDGGETWTQATAISGLAAIDDIVAATDEVLHVAGRTSTPAARLFTSWDGGADWVSSANGAPRIRNLPTHNYTNRIAVPRYAHPTIASNTVALGGLSGGGSDGVIYIGSANIL